MPSPLPAFAAVSPRREGSFNARDNSFGSVSQDAALYFDASTSMVEDAADDPDPISYNPFPQPVPGVEQTFDAKNVKIAPKSSNVSSKTQKFAKIRLIANIPKSTIRS